MGYENISVDFNSMVNIWILDTFPKINQHLQKSVTHNLFYEQLLILF